MEKAAVVFGNTLSAIGVVTAVESAQLISIIITSVISVLGFIISVVIPQTVKLINKIKKAKEDGKITDEEIDDICKDAKDLIDDIEDEIKK